MPINEYLAGKSYDPEMLAALNAAFEGACADLGVTDQTPHSRKRVATQVLMLADDRRDPDMIRTAVVSFLKARH